MPPPTAYLLTCFFLTEVVLSENEIEANGAAGVRLSDGADPLLERNTVRGSGPEPEPNPNPDPNPNQVRGSGPEPDLTLTLTLTLTRCGERS